MKQIILISDMAKFIRYGHDSNICVYPYKASDDFDEELWEERLDAADLVIMSHVGSAFTSPMTRGLEKLVTARPHYLCILHDSNSPMESGGISQSVIDDVKLYLDYGGLSNFQSLLSALAHDLGESIDVPAPKPLPYQGILSRDGEVYATYDSYCTYLATEATQRIELPLATQTIDVPLATQINGSMLDTQTTEMTLVVQEQETTDPIETFGAVGVFLYRDDWVNGIESYAYELYDALLEEGLTPILIIGQYKTKSAEQLGFMDGLHSIFGESMPFDVLINTCEFSLVNLKGATIEDLNHLDIPILQGYTVYTGHKEWEQKGISPMDLSLSIVLPEFDGVIQGGLVATRKSEGSDYGFEPHEERITALARRAKAYARLRHTKPADRKIGLILHNYPPKNSHIGSACGLDTPESVLQILRALKDEGYKVGEIPSSGAELMEIITRHATNDRDFLNQFQLDQAPRLSYDIYKKYFDSLPMYVQESMVDHWGKPPGQLFTDNQDILIPGVAFGNVWLTVQPPRGFGDNPAALYHDPVMPPTHQYLGFYYWLRHDYEAHAVIHLGTHGNLEWLPGKGAALSQACYPELNIDDLPNIYPYWTTIVGEGMQAKRRSSACLIGYLTPPMKRAGVYDEYEDLEELIDEYKHAKDNESAQVELIFQKIVDVASQVNINVDELVNHQGASMSDNQELSTSANQESSASNHQIIMHDRVMHLHYYLEDLKSRHIRSGLHILGRNPSDEEIADYIEMVAATSEVEEDQVLIDDMTTKLRHTNLELFNTIRALAGHYIEPSQGGSLQGSRGNILPTGRNFYALDERSLPTPSAYDMGCILGDKLIESYMTDEGAYPESVGMVFWADNNARSHGECIGEYFYLLGLRPVYEGSKLSNLEVIPLTELNRPRIDVTARISGLFRDMMPSATRWLAKASEIVALLEEPHELNYIKKHVDEDMKNFIDEGMSPIEAKKEAVLRVFGDVDGAYGAGVNQILENKNWTHRSELAEAYITWGGYSYDSEGNIKAHQDLFRHRLGQLDVTVKNEDNREVSLLSVDDFNAYHGGMIAATESISGKKPRSYVGDTTYHKQVVVRDLKDEIKRQFRSEAANPIFIEGMMKHGYKGAADLSSYVAHTYEWDATADMVEDWMYDTYTDKYALAPKVQEWMREVNPWALSRIAETLLEAHERGLWDANDERLENLRDLYDSLDGDLETYYEDDDE